MRRRDFLLAAAAFAAASPAAAERVPAQARIGWLAHGDTMPRHFFEEALARLGWVEGQNLTIARRFSGSGGEGVAADAAELVAWGPDVIVGLGISDARPLLALTAAIPIVVVTAGNDPVAQGFAKSLARPGGNLTGTLAGTAELVPKLLQLAHELIPGAGRISVLTDPSNLANVEPLPSIGKTLGVTLVSRHASRPDELDAVFSAAAAAGDRALVVQFGALSFEERRRIIDLAARFRMPAVYPLREYVEAGGLISYGPAIRDNFERAAVLVDKILHGAKPGDLPIEQPTRFELIANLKAAKAIGLAFPPAIIARADEVIE